MLVSSYLGRYSEKVSHVVLAESGPLTQEMVEFYKDKFEIGVGFVFHVMGAWLGTRGVSDPDQQAAADLFQYQILIAYEGKGHPMAGYYCNKQASPAALAHWRLGREAWIQFGRSYVGRGRKLRVSFVDGVEVFEREVLLLTSACDIILGVELQQRQMQYFPNAKMVLVDDVGHTLFGEKPTETLAPVRTYLNSPAPN